MALPSINEALAAAQKRKRLPTSLDTAGLRKKFSASVRRKAIFSARTHHAAYVADLAKTVEDFVAGKIDQGQARLRLKRRLAAYGYSPEGGFTGKGDIPPVPAGSLQDLSSDRRLDLILTMQWGLLFGETRLIRETTPERFALFPAWELVRIGERKVPRNWVQRWVKAGGKVVKGRLIAYKNDPIWERLGSSKLFADGLDSRFSPFWFGSGGGLVERSRPLAEKFLGPMPVLKGGPADLAANRVKTAAPWLTPGVIAKLEKELGAKASKDADFVAFEDIESETEAEASKGIREEKDAAQARKYDAPEFEGFETATDDE